MARKDTGLFDDDQGVFMISVAAELAGMHPQTLRIYESRGLIKPKRSPKKTRLYSRRDVERLRRIQVLTTEVGLNLAGVERVLELEQVMNTMRRELERMRGQAEVLERDMLQRIQEVHRSYKRELIRWEPPGAIQRSTDFKAPVRVRVERPNKTEGRKAEGRNHAT